MTIIVSQKGRNAQIIKPSGFEQEDSLQRYIHDNPESIPIYELKEDKKIFVISREFSTKSGPVDAIAVDMDGDVYIIETKLYKNPDKRTVVAQALDYGASLWKHSIDFQELLERFDRAVKEKFDLSFVEKLKEFYGLTEEQTDALLENIRNSFSDGNFKFIILMDEIGERLKDLIVFVNQNSRFDIYGVQFKYYNIDTHEIIIPKIYGVEVKKDITKQRKKILWTEPLFKEELRRNCGSEYVKIADKILNWSNTHGLNIRWGAGSKQGTFSPNMIADGKEYGLFGVYTTGRIEIVFQDLPFGENVKMKLLTDLNRIEGVEIPEKAVGTWKSFSMASILSDVEFDIFIACFENVLK